MKRQNNIFFRHSPAPTSPEKKRYQIQSALIGDEAFWRKISKLKSPVENEPEPKFMINFHCRERNGKPFMSYTLAASPADLACSIAYWILDASAKMNFDAKDFASRLSDGLLKAINALSAEDKLKQDSPNLKQEK